ncbi:MAG: DNA-binding response regulator [Firmicutes bacterium HGW-Firmicutes-11]|nr:MAG: DNA-binding response regulator [Firmicutes bacterium HGW-Firmicutes-11]
MIYCVEDDKNIRELVVYAMKSGGYQAEGYADAEEFFAGLEIAKPSLVLLDIMLPGTDGLSLLSKLRNKKDTRDIPVILLTAKGSEYDKVQGLDAGADDYIAKPFGVMELLSRVRAVLRRSTPESGSQELRVGPLLLSAEQRRVLLENEELTLTFKEFELLQHLMRNENLVLSRDKLLETIWGYDFEGETRTVDVHIRSLRQKLGDFADLIDTVRGVGYRIRSRA